MVKLGNGPETLLLGPPAKAEVPRAPRGRTGIAALSMPLGCPSGTVALIAQGQHHRNTVLIHMGDLVDTPHDK